MLLGLYHFIASSPRIPNGRGFLMKLAHNLAQNYTLPLGPYADTLLV